MLISSINAGNKSLRSAWNTFYGQADALVIFVTSCIFARFDSINRLNVMQIYVIDSTDRRRMEETNVELQKLLDEEKLANVPLLVMANKQDLLNALSPDEISAELGLNKMRERTWQILPCSARTGDGLQEGKCIPICLHKDQIT